jgi:hypothetical protein
MTLLKHTDLQHLTTCTTTSTTKNEQQPTQRCHNPKLSRDSFESTGEELPTRKNYTNDYNEQAQAKPNKKLKVQSRTQEKDTEQEMKQR